MTQLDDDPVVGLKHVLERNCNMVIQIVIQIRYILVNTLIIIILFCFEVSYLDLIFCFAENWNTWPGRSDVTASQQSENEPHCEDPDFNVSKTKVA